MTDLAVALGLVLAIEGTLYAVAPNSAKTMMRMVSNLPEGRLRIAGATALAAGVAVVWLARG